MADTAATAGQGSLRIPTGDELYDMIMQGIETDLTTDQIPLLDEKYKNETPEEAAIRAERYQRAFAEYNGQLSAYLARFQFKMRECQSTARNSLESAERTKEGQALLGLEEAMSL